MNGVGRFLAQLQKNGWQVRRLQQRQTVQELADLLGGQGAVPAGGQRARAWLQQAGVPLAREPRKPYAWGLVEAAYGVAGVGSVVLVFDEHHPRWVSLVPERLLVLLEARRVVPDLETLFRQARELQKAPGWLLLHGPSVTADIEKHLVYGVHGPAEVHLWLLEGAP